MRLDFNEANILYQNLFSSQDDKRTVLDRLANVYQNTEDRLLKTSVNSLCLKLEKLSEMDIKLMFYDIQKKKFIVTSNYKVIQKTLDDK